MKANHGQRYLAREHLTPLPYTLAVEVRDAAPPGQPHTRKQPRSSLRLPPSVRCASCRPPCASPRRPARWMPYVVPSEANAGKRPSLPPPSHALFIVSLQMADDEVDNGSGMCKTIIPRMDRLCKRIIGPYTVSELVRNVGGDKSDWGSAHAVEVPVILREGPACPN
jgi:hypothetical protein